jgi:hypothetical protein
LDSDVFVFLDPVRADRSCVLVSALLRELLRVWRRWGSLGCSSRLPATPRLASSRFPRRGTVSAGNTCGTRSDMLVVHSLDSFLPIVIFFVVVVVIVDPDAVIGSVLFLAVASS